MRLIHTKSKRLQEFRSDIPSYAILSHTWGVSEISYQDIQKSWFAHKWKKSWTKIEGSCVQARKDGLEYVWVDTCSIDKTSSAELQESINSMYGWYGSASVCYAYLSDVPPGDLPTDPKSAFRNSRWFTRGWTLQEFLAPTSVKFFDSEWNLIGDKYQLRKVISEITGIAEEFIGSSPFEVLKAMQKASVAQKMSWAANRSTTRVEDKAYCLLGLFGINMPLLYGEGDRAFLRLQEEIMRISHDQSILAWGYKKSTQNLWGFSQALAASPSEFSECSEIVSFGSGDLQDSFYLDQRGLWLDLPALCTPNHANLRVLYYALNCGKMSGSHRLHLAIPLFRIYQGKLRRIDSRSHSESQLDWKDWQYFRLTLRIPTWIHPNNVKRAARYKACLPRSVTHPTPRQPRMHLNLEIQPSAEYYIAGIYPPEISCHNILHFPDDEYSPSHAGRIYINLSKNSSKGIFLVLRYLSGALEADFSTALENAYAQIMAGESLPLKSNKRRDHNTLVRSCIAQVAGVPEKEVVDSVSLVDLGIDSLSSMDLLEHIRSRFEFTIPSGLFDKTRTVSDIEKVLVLCSNPVYLNSGHLSFTAVLRFTPLKLEAGLIQVPEDMLLLDHSELLNMSSLKMLDYQDLERECRFAFDYNKSVVVSLSTEKKLNTLRISFEDEGATNLIL
jgi:acyl carrier protein